MLYWVKVSTDLPRGLISATFTKHDKEDLSFSINSYRKRSLNDKSDRKNN